MKAPVPRAVARGRSVGPEAALIDAWDLHRRLVDEVPDYAILALDSEGTILTWNAGAERMTGYREGEIVGRHVSSLYSPEDVEAGLPARDLDSAVAEGRLQIQRKRRRKNGELFSAQLVLTALSDENGELIGFGEVSRDLTEAQRTALALAESEQWLRLVVHSVRDYAIFMLDTEGRVRSWNDGAERIKGYAAHEIIGTHFSAFYPPEDLEWDKPALELEVAAREGRFEDEGWRLRKDGSRFWANVVITALHDDSGAFVGFAKITRDLTERREADQRALAAARRVAEVETGSRAKSEFLAAMSHELRTPLNAIGGYVDLLALGIRGPLTRQQHEDLERIRRSQQHLIAVISDLLNFSRVEAGQVDYNIEPVPIAEVIESTRGMVEAQTETRAITLHVDADDDDDIVLADRTKLEQILLNLLTNALKFTPRGGQIRITWVPTSERLMLNFEDTGVGIPADQLDSIFEPFVQVAAERSPRGGMGLGLAISREFARGMQGDLVVRSQLGEGSTFTLVLPRYRGADSV